MKISKRLVIHYSLTYTLGLFLAIYPFYNPYFFITVLFSLLVFLFYALMTINLGFTILYIYLLYTKNELIPNKCYDIGNYRIFCHLCNHYIECKTKRDKL